MAFRTMEELGAFLKNKPILVANRGIPARRICRSIRERFHAVAVMTATDIDKTSPAASSAQELMLLGADPNAYLDLDLIISKAKSAALSPSIPAGASRRKMRASPANAPRRELSSSVPQRNP